MRMTLLLVWVVVLSGCASGGGELERLAGRYLLVAQSPITIPAGTAHVTFQGGRPGVGKNRFEPYCEFEVNTVAQRPQTIRPDEFVVSKITRRTMSDELTGWPAAPPLGDFGCSEDLYYETKLWLYSERQPDVRALICREMFDSCGGGHHPGPQEIRGALGDWFRIRGAKGRGGQAGW